MHPFAAQQSLFRAYDIRGERQHFTAEFITAVGVAFAHLYQLQNDANAKSAQAIVIGYDVRNNSDTIAQTLADILHEYGLTVIQLGLITTPMMAFWAQRYDGHGIMVTASHSDKNTLGIKWLINNASPSAADIQALYKSLAAIQLSKSTNHQHYKVNNSSRPNSDIISLPTETVTPTYIDAIAQVFSRIERQKHSASLHTSNTAAKLDVTIVIDCMNGASSRIAQPLFERFCQRVILLNDRPDGSFPTGNPDPTETNRLAELQQIVIVSEADMGLAFDGDADRLMIVDNRGKVVSPDHLLYLLAQVAITERPTLAWEATAPHIVFDVKCSHHLPRLLKKIDAVPIMSKTGSSFLRQQLQTYNSHAIFAGELSGHFIFNDGYFIAFDDAMYAGLRLLHWLAGTIIDSDISDLLGIALKPCDYVEDKNSDYLRQNAWGASKREALPYRLTDITQYLPQLVSTADHYLPLPNHAPNDCSIVQHLAAFCRYLLRLVKLSNTDSSAIQEQTPNQPSCCCFDTLQQITLAQAQQLLPVGTVLSCIDGVRLDFDRGFGVLRQSNTSHSLTVRFAGDTVADLKEVQARFVALCRPFDIKIAGQIAAIHYE